MPETAEQAKAREEFERTLAAHMQAAEAYLHTLEPTEQELQDAGEMLCEQFRDSLPGPELWSTDLLAPQIAEARRWAEEEENK